MKLTDNILAFAALLVACAGTSALDTNRDAQRFSAPTLRQAGFDYSDHLNVIASTEVESGGMDIKASADFQGDSEMKVSSLGRGVQKIDFVLQDIYADINSFIYNLHCDSNNRASSSSPDCRDLYDVVGFQETLVVDSEGNIVKVTGPDGTDMLEQVSPISSQLTGAQHLEHHSQVVTILPDHAVKPGDTWEDDFSLDQLGGIGTFTGKCTLKGYTDCGDNDCAVFALEGSLHMDLASVASSVYVDPRDLPVSSADADITVEMHFDNKHQISRWTQMNITTAFDTPNPMSPNDPTMMHVPLEFSITTSTDITRMPDTETAETSNVASSTTSAYSSASTSTSTLSTPTATYTSAQEEKPVYVSASERSSSNSSGSSSNKSKGGFSFMAFFWMAVVVTGAGGYALYVMKKKQQQHNGFLYDADAPIEMGSGSRPPVYTPIV